MDIAFPKKRKKVFFVLSCFFTTLTNLVTNFLFGEFVSMTEHRFGSEIAGSFFVLSAIYVLVPGLFLWLGENIKFPYIESYMTELRRMTVNKLLRLSYAEFAKKPRNTYLSHLVNDMDSFSEQYFGALQKNIASAGTCVLGLIVLLYMWPVLSIGVFLFFGTASVVGFYFRRRMTRVNREVKKMQVEVTAGVENAFSGMELIKMHGAEEHFLNKNTDNIFKLESKKAEYLFWGQMQSVILEQLGTVVVMVVLLFASLKMANGDFSTAQASLFILVANMITTNFSSFWASYNEMEGAKTLLGEGEESIVPVDTPYEKKGTDLFSFHRSLEIKNLSFGFGEKSIFRNTSAVFAGGGKYLLKGKSGQGKTTLFQLLTGVYDNYGGEILFDGTELRNIAERELNEKIAIIDQDIFLFEDTVRNNICLYHPYTEEEIERAVAGSGLKRVIEELPQGMDTMLTENGKNLSGGQRQRIAVARALIRQAELLLADEITASLPDETAEQIEKTVLGLDMTVILISHRENTQNNKWNGIFELHGGSLHGNHDTKK